MEVDSWGAGCGAEWQTCSSVTVQSPAWISWRKLVGVNRVLPDLRNAPSEM
jgi:hypothetical protein